MLLACMHTLLLLLHCWQVDAMEHSEADDACHLEVCARRYASRQSNVLGSLMSVLVSMRTCGLWRFVHHVVVHGVQEVEERVARVHDVQDDDVAASWFVAWVPLKAIACIQNRCLDCHVWTLSAQNTLPDFFIRSTRC